MKLYTNLNLLGNQILNAVLQLLGSDPTGKEGQFYWNTLTKRPKIHDGTVWRTIQTDADRATANGLATLDAGGKLTIGQIPDAIMGQLEYQGVYDASGGTTPGGAVKGYYWVISIAGTINAIVYGVGDWIVYNGTSFDKVDNTDAVTMVAGRTGAIVLVTNDITESTDKRYVTDAQKTILGNTSNTNTGDETTTTLGTKIFGASAKTTPVDADTFALTDSAASNGLKKVTWSNLKDTLVTYFNTLYNNYTHPTGDGNLHIPANSTINNGKFLQATAVAGVYQWANTPTGSSKIGFDIGDNSATSFLLTHNFNTRDVVVAISEKASPYEIVYTDVELTSVNTITIRFGTAPTTGQFRVVVIA